MAVRIVRGHDLHTVPGTEYVHCRECGGSGYFGRPNSLTSDCPLAKTDTLHLNNIFKQKLDYVRGKWVQKNVAS